MIRSAASRKVGSVRATMMRLGCLLLIGSAFLLGCGPLDRPFQVESVAVIDGESRFELVLALGYVPGSLSVWLDDQRVEIEAESLRVGLQPIPMALPVTGGRHVVKLRARFLRGVRVRGRSGSFSFFVPIINDPNAASLVSSWPTQGTVNLTRGEWIQLEFSASPSAALVDSFEVQCAEKSIEFETHPYRKTFFVLNPKGQLPAGVRCFFSWGEGAANRRLIFSTAVAGAPAWVEYDRDIAGLSSPFPDDFFTRKDVASATGLRIELPSVVDPSPLDAFSELLASEVEGLDGWSPVGHIVISLSDAVDPASIPQSPAESIHPASALQLLDTDPRSETFGQRVPFIVETREDLDAAGKLGHSLLLFPLLPSRLGGRYAVIVTRAIRASPGRPFGPSPFMTRVLDPPQSSDSDAVVRARASVFSAIWVSEHIASPPIPRDDIALMVRFTTGSLEDLSQDLLHIRRQIHELPLPEFSIDEVRPETGAVAAIVTGTWQAPRWREGANLLRDDRGRPVIGGTKPIAFSLALPRERAPGGAPLVIYQHGNPGSAQDEVPAQARRSLAGAGFAVLGFTDVFNRELSVGESDESSVLTQWASSFIALTRNGRLPDYWIQTHAEQIAFLRLAQALGGLDVLPLADPDGRHDLDLEAPIAYLGVSEGANHAPAFLAYAPEVRSAALVVGGAPLAESLTYQIDASGFGDYAHFLMGDQGRDLWLGLSLLQTAMDRQDPIHHARFLYREPVSVGGDLRKPSILLIAGVEDSRIPNRFTDALAWLLGPIPMIEPVARIVSFLPHQRGPIRSNIDERTSAAYTQIVPAGLVGARVSAACSPLVSSRLVASEGHFCAQVAPVSIEQRRLFFQSALRGDAPTIFDLLVSAQGVEAEAAPRDLQP